MKYKKTKTDIRKKSIDIEIDALTRCLIDRRTGEEIKTEYKK